jgi:hypothetical protein
MNTGSFSSTSSTSDDDDDDGALQNAHTSLATKKNRLRKLKESLETEKKLKFETHLKYLETQVTQLKQNNDLVQATQRDNVLLKQRFGVGCVTGTHALGRCRHSHET